MEVIPPPAADPYTGTQSWSIYEEPEVTSERTDTPAAVRYSPARSGGVKDEEKDEE